MQDIIQKYNRLKDIALVIKKFKLDIPLREMSEQDKSLIDIDKLTKVPKLMLKK